MKTTNFAAIKNILYTVYICICAFFLMNDFKVTTLIMMIVLAPSIILLEHYEANKTTSSN